MGSDSSVGAGARGAAAAAAWHRERHARLVASHPRIHALQGPYPLSQGIIVVLVAAEVALAWYAEGCSWLRLFLLAAGVGAFISHALGVLIHEGTHNLIARGSLRNRIWILIANLPLVAPAAIEFRAQHLLHHKYLGEVEVEGRDTQAPTHQEIAWVNSGFWRKFSSFTFGRFFYKTRPANRVVVDRFLVLNWLLQIAACGAVFALVGGKGLAFLLVSVLLAFGPHPVGARRLSEHFPVRALQPSVSYYGVLNAVSLNVGYHVEHHDFPAVAWARLPALRREAQADYDSLFAFRSWSRLLFRYLFNSHYRIDHYVGFGTVLGDTAGTTSASEPDNQRCAAAR